MIEYRLIYDPTGEQIPETYNSLEEAILGLHDVSMPLSEYTVIQIQNGITTRFSWSALLGTALNMLIPKFRDGDVRSRNVGASDYSKHKIQPWDIWMEYHLNPWDADIVKRILRTKSTDSRKLDYEKIIHICQERIRQIDEGYEF